MVHQERKKTNEGQKPASSEEHSTMSEQFRTLLADLGWNQSRAAEELKITRSYVNNILHGRGEPSATLMELLEVKARIHTKPEVLKQKTRLHREVGEIEKSLNQLTPEKRDIVLGQLANLIRSFVRLKN